MSLVVSWCVLLCLVSQDLICGYEGLWFGGMGGGLCLGGWGIGCVWGEWGGGRGGGGG